MRPNKQPQFNESEITLFRVLFDKFDDYDAKEFKAV